MEDIKKEKKNSFFKGVAVATIVVGTILTAFYSILMISEAKRYRERIDEIVKVTEAAQEEGGDLISEEFIQKSNLIYNGILKEFYFDTDIDTGKMHDLMYKAIVSSLGDKYAEYYTKEEMDELMQGAEGSYSGIGSYVGTDEESGYPILSGVFEGSPAKEAGLRDGDIIYEVNGENIGGLTLTEAVNMIKGPEGTTVDLTIVREGLEEMIYVTVERRKIESPTVNHSMKENDIAYIQITEFDDVTINQFDEAYKDINKQGAKALIIDLRSNGGGNLDAVLDIACHMLPKGLITYTEERNGTVTEYTCDGKTPIQIPVVVLTNEYTASASELLTGALKDYGIAESIGTNTYGKGIVQSVYPFTDGSGIKFTTSRYYTPKGNCIHEVGIAPDIELEFDSERYYSDEKYDNQLEYAIEYLSKKIK